jgi:histidine triad (HIT) family protein
MGCVFCKIAKKEAPADIVYEDEEFMVFPDIRPKAAVHLLLIPKKHIPTLQDAREHDIELLGKLLLTAQKVGRLKQLKGYKLQMNVGKEGGQEVGHIHLHLLAQ